MTIVKGPNLIGPTGLYLLLGMIGVILFIPAPKLMAFERYN